MHPAQSLHFVMTAANPVTVDLTGPSLPFDRYFQRGIGSCHAYLTLREDFREHVREVQREIGFGGIRFHNIFSDWMGVVMGGDDPDGGACLNFQNVDKVYDFFLAQGMKPFVELGFMPARLASGAQTIFHYRANVTPPADWSQWARLVRRFTQHLVDRYGLAEVLGWHFEVWNEPDLIGGFWTGTQEDYFRLYREAALAVKSVDARLRVGGPATSKTAWVPVLLTHCAKHGLPVDFISTHHYAVDADLVIDAPDGPMYYRGPGAMARDVARVRAEIDDSAFPDAELHFTEWNTSPAHEDVFGKDSAFTAAFALQAIKDVSGLADSYMWWTLSDIFEESGPGARPFSGKYGLINLHGIRKPIFHAYRWLAGMHDRELSIAHASARATVSAAGDVRLLAWNLPEVIETDLTGGDWPLRGESRSEVFMLKSLPSGRRRLRVWIVDTERGNALTAWRAMGAPDYPSGAQLTELRAKSEPVLLRDETFDLKTGVFELAFGLPAQATVYAELERG
jgi:xylan 1,4-beta-xylosidase